ncbi:DUF294 nucleotidyltransferase-like domain-containing protein [Aquisalimonas asiatica]|uniref:CBS domain-containing protein n=1 Tax=Aquisalimonas asiatica TaxID=406100 RepID=A0A1H8Q4I0_9GAMM|nr:DUF294 nucleotidyltransferase-like domain-containing protein [Aquisalimonas asiatica]SEO48817.1 CBS domain-containing protein [Aquisalimonas asiatica]
MTFSVPYLSVFQQTAGDLMGPALCRLQRDTPCGSAVQQLADTGQGCAVIVDRGQRVQGLLTRADVIRRVACRVSADTPIDEVMSRPALIATTTMPAYRALAELQARRERWAPVVDASERLQGLFDAQTALAHGLPAALQRLAAVTGPATDQGLRRCRNGQAHIIDGMAAEGASAAAMQRMLASLNDDLHARAVEMGVNGMAEDGWGRPPVAFAMIVMGSSGRTESFLDPDQDNGFVIADYPDQDHGQIDRYFIELARRTTRSLDAAGIPLCKGHVMATNPLWRKTLPQWQDQIRRWLRRRSETGFLQSNILLDCRGVAGDMALAAELRDHMVAQFAASRSYVRSLTLNESTRGVGLGWFDRLITESEDSAHPGELDLKRLGLMPIVEVARLYATAHGITACATHDRLDALAEANVLSGGDVAALKDAHEFIAGLIFRRQLNDIAREARPGKHITPGALTPAEQDRLVTSLKSVQGMVKRLARDLVGPDAPDGG